MSRPNLIVSTTSSFTLLWKDAGTGGDVDGSFWRPMPDTDYYIIGDICKQNYSRPTTSAYILKVENDDKDSPLLKRPVRFEMIWCDKGSGGDKDGSIWWPVAPDGYVSIGGVAHEGYDEPSLKEIPYRCVRKDQVDHGVIGYSLWDDKGTGSDSDGSFWELLTDKNHYINCFIPNDSHGKPQQSVFIPQKINNSK